MTKDRLQQELPRRLRAAAFLNYPPVLRPLARAVATIVCFLSRNLIGPQTTHTEVLLRVGREAIVRFDDRANTLES